MSRLFCILVLSLTSLCLASHLSSEIALLPYDEDQMTQQNFMNTANEPGAVLFTPPKGWHLADPKALPSSVKVMVVGKGAHEFPPSLNLGTETYSGTLKQYLKRIKEINASKGADWKDLGKIRTQAGEASLSQVEAKTEWGNVKMMHVILNKNGVIYILTAASLKDEFPKFYKDFFNSLQSLRFNKTAHEMIADSTKRAQLEAAEKALKTAWIEMYAQEKNSSAALTKNAINNKVFNSETFQNEHWIPFEEKIAKEFSDLDENNRTHLLLEARQGLEK